jgi:hypothetical protein
MGELAVGAAAAVELLHCASLVHDDLPCFDNASIRRGRPSVHRAFGARHDQGHRAEPGWSRNRALHQSFEGQHDQRVAH